MLTMTAGTIVKNLFDEAGITVGGSNPWDIQVKNEGFYKRVMKWGSLGLGESYMDGWWDCERIDELVFRLVKAQVPLKILHPALLLRYPPLIFQYKLFAEKFIEYVLLNRQTKAKAFEVAEVHYDTGNDLFELMLDKKMAYSCAYWRNSSNLDKAQEAKLDLACRKLGIKKGMRVLDIGCGFGSFAKYAAEKYGAECVGITVSKEQAKFARHTCSGLPVEIRLQNYEELNDATKFDCVVSIAAFEAFGRKNHRKFMTIVHNLLKDDGLFLLHTIGRKSANVPPDFWILKYIFPNGEIPSERHVTDASANLFSILDWHNFGSLHYYKTLLSWIDNFERNWNKLEKGYAHKIDGKFYRMWRYYLHLCAGVFKSESLLDVWQLVLAKNGYREKYAPMR